MVAARAPWRTRPTSPTHDGMRPPASNHRSALAAVLSVTPVHGAMRLAGYPRSRSHAARAPICWYIGGSTTSRRATSSTTTAAVRMLSWRVQNSSSNARTHGRDDHMRGRGRAYRRLGKPSHTARYQGSDATIHYPFHPRSGERVEIVRRHQRRAFRSSGTSSTATGTTVLRRERLNNNQVILARGLFCPRASPSSAARRNHLTASP